MLYVNNEDILYFLKSLPITKKKDFKELFKEANEMEIELLSKLLTFDPKKRISINEALNHAYFDDYREFLNSNKAPLQNIELDFDNKMLNENEIRDLIFDEYQKMNNLNNL
jgi:mitogen-activated protein kinase 1/3